MAEMPKNWDDDTVISLVLLLRPKSKGGIYVSHVSLLPPLSLSKNWNLQYNKSELSAGRNN